MTNIPSPDAANEPYYEEEDDAVKVEKDEPVLSGCPEGKFRNPETNRCKNIVTTASLTPCRAGQERNPDTNRCRKVASASTFAACKEGQERNPETNRCRNIAVAAAASPSVGDLSDSVSSGNINYTIMSVVSLMIVGYGAYEYRHDIANWTSKMRSRAGKGQSSNK